jgi:hypothetical protein
VSLSIDAKNAWVNSVERGVKQLVVSVWGGPAIYLIDIASGKTVATFTEPGLEVIRSHFIDGERTVLAVCGDRIVRLWSVADGKKIRQFTLTLDNSGAWLRWAPPVGPGPREPMNIPSLLSPEGNLIAYPDGGGHICINDTRSGNLDRQIHADFRGSGGWCFSPDGRVLDLSDGNLVRLWEIASGKERRSFSGHRAEVSALAFSRDGRTLFSGSNDTTAVVWDLIGDRTGATRIAALTPAELDALWAALAGDDAAKAFTAMRSLVAAPAQALPFLSRQLQPRKLPDADLVTRLIKELDSDQFTVREKAREELEKIGSLAVPVARKALASGPSAEARRQLEALIAKCDAEQKDPRGPSLREIRALEVLELDGSRQARDILRSLTTGASESRLTVEAKASLGRLERRSQSSP